MSHRLPAEWGKKEPGATEVAAGLELAPSKNRS